MEVLDICAKSSSSSVGSGGGSDADGGSLIDVYSTHVAALYDCAHRKVCASSSVHFSSIMM